MEPHDTAGENPMQSVTDGFGNVWPRCDLGSDCGLHVVRPGKVQCWCDNAKAEVLALRREISALKRDVYACPPCGENDYEGLKWSEACEELEREVAVLRRRLAADPPK